MPSVGVVIAAYKEDLHWVHNIDTRCYNVYVYCKDPARVLSLPKCVRRETLPNVGREADTYLHHIITHYESLDDIILFLQGDPFYHIHVDLNTLLKEWTDQVAERGFSTNFRQCDIHGTHYKWVLPVYKGQRLEQHGLTLGQWFEKYLEIPFPSRLLWYGSAQFAVASWLLQKRSLESYKAMKESLCSVNPVEAHFMERSWYYVSSIHTVNHTVAIQDVHVDETRFLKHLLERVGERCVSFDYKHEECPDDADIVILAANELAYKHMRQPSSRPFLVNLVNANNVDNILRNFVKDQHFRGAITTSIEAYEQLKAHGVLCCFAKKKYDLTPEQVQSSCETRRIVSLIHHYPEFSAKNGCYQHFERLQKTLPNWNISNYGAPNNFVSDIEEIQQARYLLHIKHWGHVCNAVVKALGLGVPVLMDRATFETGRYRAYVRPGENGMVFDSISDLADYLANKETEHATCTKLKAMCVNEAHTHHFSFQEDCIQELVDLLSACR